MTSTPKRPNILLIMSDEHGPMFSSTYGHPRIDTPGMDRLATEGATFMAAYCNSPTCVPSRMSFLSGRYPSSVDVFDNASPLPSQVPTWAHLAAAAGYEVALSGKQHFIGPDVLHGFSRQLARDLHAESRHGIADWTAGVRRSREPWPEPFRAGPGIGEHIRVDDAVEAAAVDWLRDPERRGTPWLLCASFMAPHFPLIVPSSYWQRHPFDEVDMPRIPPGHLESQHRTLKDMRSLLGLIEYTEEQTRRSRAAYFGLVNYLDDKISRLLDLLDATGQAENTVVIYTSDHGEMAGEHGMWRKSNFYEQSVRIPLQIRWPAEVPAGRRVAQVVSLIDVAASLSAIVGVAPPTEWDGEDLLPLARQGTRPDWKDEAFSEYCSSGVVRPVAMLRRGNFKLIYQTDEAPQLYDLSQDPGEFHDLGLAPEYDTIRAGLRQRLLEIWDPIATESRVLRSQRERRLILGATGWTPGLSPEDTRNMAHMNLSLPDPTDYRKEEYRSYSSASEGRPL